MRVLAEAPDLLLLDEPVAGMTDEETARTAELFFQNKVLPKQVDIAGAVWQRDCTCTVVGEAGPTTKN